MKYLHPDIGGSAAIVIVLSASDGLSAGTLQLEIGTLSESVSVVADITPVQVDSAERSAVLDRKDISSLNVLTAIRCSSYGCFPAS